MLRRLLGIVALCGLCSGLVVATSHPVPAVAASPPPDSIASYAGGIGSGLATQLAQQPAGLAASGAVLYAADQHFRVVRAIDLTAGSERIFAGGGSSLADGVSATSAAIYPRGLAVDASGNVLIADPPHNKVRMVSTTGIITTVAGTGAAGFSGDGAAASAATLSGPEGVGVDTTGNIFIADTGNHRIRKVDTSGTISTFAGNGVAANSGDGGPATSASLNSPAGVAIDGSANVFIADTNNHEIRKVSGGIITRLAGTGVAGYSGDGGPATSAQLLGPSGVLAGASGDVFIADNGNTRVRKLSGGTTTTFAGGGAAFGDGSPAASSVLLSAVAIAVDASANLYIADSTGGRIRRVDHATAILSTTAGTSGACGYAGDGAQAAAAQICPAAGMTVDSSNNLYFSSTTPFGYWSSASVGRVRKITAAGVISTVAGGGAGCTEPCAATSAVLTTPGGLAADSAGDIFFVDGQLIQKLDTAGTLSVYAGTGAMGYNGDNQLATAASLNSPAGVAVDSSGNVYIADGGNSRVRKVDRGTGMISTVAGTGVPGFSGDGGQATSAQLYARGVAVDGSGNLYIADSGRVRKVSSGVITTYAGQGNPSYAGQPLGDGGRATAAFVDPRAIYVDGSGRLLIADGLNARIRVVSTDGFISTVSGCSGVAPDVSCPPPPVDAPNNWSYSPTLVAVDSSDDAFIGDAQNRILRVQAPVAPGAPAGVAAAAAGDSQVSVRWTAPGADGGNPIYRYTVTPYRGATALNPVQVTGQPVPTSTVVFIANGQTYTFTVTASNVFATSPASPASNPVTPVIAPAGQIVTHAGSVGTGRALSLGQVPYSIAVGPMINGPSNMGSPHVYVGDLANPVVRDLDTWSGIETALVGNDTDGHSGDGGPATGASMAGAGAMVYCADGQTYFADTYNFVIRSVDGSGHVVSTVAGTGQRGNSGDGVPATQATFGRIFGLACRTGGGLYVADSDNGAIRLIDGSGVIHNWWTGFSFPTGIAEVATDQVYVSDAGADNAVWWLANGVATVFAGTPTHAGFSGDGGSATAAMLNDPRGLLFWNGSLFIVDGANNRIRRVDQAGKISTFAGTGVAGFAGDGGPPASAELNHPASIAAGPFQGFYTAFYIADFGNGRVRAINLNPCAPQTCSPVVTRSPAMARQACRVTVGRRHPRSSATP